MIIHDPLKQEFRPYRFAKFLQREAEPITRTVAVDASENGGRRKHAALNGQGELHKHRIVLSNAAR